MIAAESWDQMCRRVEDLLEACDKWNLSISVAKSFWGMDKVGYLGHRVSIGGLEVNPKDLKSLTDLPFPGSLRSMQSFLGSLNYYSRFIEDYAIYASVLYELREVEFAELEKRSDLRKIMDQNDPIARDHGLQLVEPLNERWIRAHKAFITMKTKSATTPILRLFDETRTPVVIVKDYAIYAFFDARTRRDLPPGCVRQPHLEDERVELQCDRKGGVGIAEDLGSLLQFTSGREIRVLTRHSTLARLFKSTGLQGRLGQWSALLAPWTLEITKYTKGEVEILGAIAASITPRAKIDDALTDIAPRKEPKRRIQAPIPTVDRGEELWVVSFDGSARVKRGGGTFSAIVWLKARSGYLESLTVNEAEYNGLVLGLGMLENLDRKRLVICGDSNLVIRQVRGEIDCKAPGLTLLKQKALDRLRKWSDHDLVHVQRDCNGGADSLASAALQRPGGIEVQGEPEFQDMFTLNRLDEILIPKTGNPVVRVAAVTTRASRVRSPAGVMQEDLIREMRVDRIKRDQEEEVWIAGMKKYLSGSIAAPHSSRSRSYDKIAADYEADEQDLFFYCPSAPRSGDDRDRLLRLVVPETLQSDVLLHYRTTLEGGHQEVGRTYQQIRDHFYWRVERTISDRPAICEKCVDCETGKGRPVIRGESLGNLQATYPLQIIAMDHIPSLPRSHKGNTELLIWVDLFTGYVIAKASTSRSAQTVTESYEECVFRRFGTNEMIRHDREPGSCPISSGRLARSWDNGSGRRWHIGHKPTGPLREWALKMYVRYLDQKDWDEYAERLTFAINTAHDRIRGDTLHYLIDVGGYIASRMHYTARSRCTAMALSGPAIISAVPRASQRQIEDRPSRHNEDVGSHQIEAGSRVWLYLDRVKEGYARKLAHLWHGPFRVAEKINEFSIKLEIAGTGCQIFPVVHVSKLKLVKDFPDRPRIELSVDESDRLDFDELKLVKDFPDRPRIELSLDESDRLDFDEVLLPEDSWIPDLGADEYEVEWISDVRSGKKTRFGRIYREFLVHWVGYDEPT
ncbi:LOW QUALITY PROTEIN: reverse transcriptase [Phytophthora megakarya]|uniref:Reverse transcriptase n=1 Tax=Phytophthora megakarya TaxID=4795 RepID=A0A225VNC1_9STRA|nr:LOW QUALITY PROTEIN: reverse transcriptase [Phytophthora megakarya]